MSIWPFSKKGTCVHCGQPILAGSEFCPYCGTMQGEALTNCPRCGALNRIEMKRCGKCETALDPNQRLVMRPKSDRPQESGRWGRGEGEFAVRIEESDLKGVLNRGLVVEPGCRALMIVDGKLVDDLPSGKYDLGSFLSRLLNFDFTRKTTVIVADVSDVVIYIDTPGLQDKDGIPLEVRLQLTFNLLNVESFFVTMMKERAVYRIEDLRDYLLNEVRGGLAPAIRKLAYEQLVVMDREALNRFSEELRSHLQSTLSGTGLKLSRLNAVNVSSEAMSSLMEARVKLRLKVHELRLRAEEQQVARDEPELEKQATQDVLNQLRDQLAAARAQKALSVEDREKRLDLEDRLRKAEVLDVMSQITNAEDLDKFRLSVDSEKLLREDEWQSFQEGLEQNREDRLSARRFLVSKLEMMRSNEIEELRQTFLAKMQKAADEAELEKLKQELQRKGYLRDYERAQMTIDYMHRLTEMKETKRAELDVEMMSATTELDKRRIQAQIRRLEADVEDYEDRLDLEKVRMMKAMQIEMRRMELALAQEERAFEAKLAEVAKQADHMRNLALRQAGHNQEMEKIRELSLASVEALISMSPNAQAQMLAELQRTKALGHLTEEQILAMAAGNSPEVARAFQERYKALSGPERDQFFQQVLRVKDDQIAQQDGFRRELDVKSREEANRLAELARLGIGTQSSQAAEREKVEREKVEIVREVGDKAMERMSDVAGAAAGNPGLGAARAGSLPFRTCPGCGNQVQQTWNACAYCGHDLKQHRPGSV